MRDILIRAKEIIKRGWCKGKYEKTIGLKRHYCMIGAISKASEYESGMYKNVIRYVEEFTPNNSNLAFFNDAASRRKEQVIRVFDKAIKGLG